MDTSRDDVGIAIRSAFLRRGTQQRFSLFILVILSIILIFFETIEAKPLNFLRSFIKDVVYRGALVVSTPSNLIGNFSNNIRDHIDLYKNYDELKKENEELKNNVSNSDYLELENTQLRKLIDEQTVSQSNLTSARVMIDKQSPYLNSFIINVGTNRGIKNGMAVLHGKNFIGRIVDVNFFSSRVLLVSDLNSKIPIISSPSSNHAILSGKGKNEVYLEYLSKDHKIKDGDKIFTSGKEGIFSPGVPIGKAKIENSRVKVILFSNLSQITFVNIDIGGFENNK